MARSVPATAEAIAVAGKGVHHVPGAAGRKAGRDAIRRAPVAGERPRRGGHLRARRAAADTAEEHQALLAVPYTAAAVAAEAAVLPEVGPTDGRLAAEVPGAAGVAVAVARHRRRSPSTQPVRPAAIRCGVATEATGVMGCFPAFRGRRPPRL